MGKMVEKETCLFFSVKNEKIVEGYGFSSLLNNNMVVEFGTFRKKIPFGFKSFRSFIETQLEFLFEEIQVRKVYVKVVSPLIGMVGLAKRMGFTIEAILREDTVYDGKPRDIVVLGMLRREF